MESPLNKHVPYVPPNAQGAAHQDRRVLEDKFTARGQAEHVLQRAISAFRLALYRYEKVGMIGGRAFLSTFNGMCFLLVAAGGFEAT